MKVIKTVGEVDFYEDDETRTIPTSINSPHVVVNGKFASFENRFVELSFHGVEGVTFSNMLIDNRDSDGCYEYRFLLTIETQGNEVLCGQFITHSDPMDIKSALLPEFRPVFQEMCDQIGLESECVENCDRDK